MLIHRLYIYIHIITCTYTCKNINVNADIYMYTHICMYAYTIIVGMCHHFSICIDLLSQMVLDIRQAVFGGNNLYVAIACEDLAYATYVYEYSSGKFADAR